MADNLLEKIKEKIDNLVTLEIVTVVGDVAPALAEGKKSEKPVIGYSKNPKVILTRVNLIQGDITTVFHEEFVTGKYQDLRNFHAAREKEGYEMVKANIAALEKLWEFAKSIIPTSTPTSTSKK